MFREPVPARRTTSRSAEVGLPRREPWPELSLASWRDTYRTLHLYFQIVGKVRLALTKKTNQWWNVPFYLTTRGLTTSPMPYEDRTIEIAFDFANHRLSLTTSDGGEETISLEARPVRDFYRLFFDTLESLGVRVHVWPVPVEIPEKTRFTEDVVHAAYDPEKANRLWRVLRRTGPVFEAFRAQYRGKCSPVHFFWGSFDLAVTRFSGRRVQSDRSTAIERDAYDEELQSLGFWPGEAWAESGGEEALFYAYAVPEPAGYSTARVLPGAAYYSDKWKEFVLPYEAVRKASDPNRTILAFAESTYGAGALLGNWDRDHLAYP